MSKYKWFVEPLNDSTNEIICRTFVISEADDRVCEREVWLTSKVCDTRSLIEITEDQKNIVISNSERKRLSFQIYRQIGGGKILRIKKYWVEGRAVYHKCDENYSFDSSTSR
jgi:hypothetical protein